MTNDFKPGPAAGEAANEPEPARIPAARLFDLPAGERTELVIRRVGMRYDDGGFMVNRRVACSAVPTDQFEELAGTNLRLFVDIEPPLEGFTTIWLEDGPLARAG